MVIHHAGSLHVGITDCRSKKFEAAFFHILADGIGDRCACRGAAAGVVDRLTIGHKAVQVFIE